MSLALLRTMLLRESTDPNLTTKGSTLTFAEMDSRIKILYAAIEEVAGAEVPGISPYNPATEYSNAAPDYVTYDGNTWEYINATPSTGTTPGTDASVWSLASSGVFVHAQNSDTILAEGTASEVTASELRTFIDGDPEQTAKDYADSLVVGLWDDRGNYDASVNTFPASGGSALSPAGAVLKGDIWTVSVGGTLGGNVVAAGDTVRALSDTPGQTSSNWAIAENNIGYVPLNKAGDTMSGDLNMGGNDITGIGSLTASGASLPVIDNASNIAANFVARTLNNTSGGANFYWGDATNGPAISTNGFKAHFKTALLAADRIFELPNTAGTFALTVDKLSAFAATTSAELAGVISDETGTGALVFANTPTLVTPVLGAATGTSLVLSSILTASSDSDSTHTFGRAKIGSVTTDELYLAHFDHLTATNYCLRHTSAAATILNGVGTISLRIGGNEVISVANALFTISDARNFAFSAATGTKLGTGTTQKIGFWNATPVVQPTTAGAAATLVSNAGTALTSTDTFDGYTLLQVVKALRNTGILA